MKNDPFAFLYDTKDEKAIFGSHFCGPARLEHNKLTLVAQYDADNDSDGTKAEVFASSLPSTFYTVKACGRSMSTGSGNGMAKLCAELAEAISTGMMVIE